MPWRIGTTFRRELICATPLRACRGSAGLADTGPQSSEAHPQGDGIQRGYIRRRGRPLCGLARRLAASGRRGHGIQYSTRPRKDLQGVYWTVARLPESCAVAASGRLGVLARSALRVFASGDVM